MKRKMISLLLLLMLCLNLAVSVSAARVDFIRDSLEILTESELESLNDMASEVYADTGVGVYFVYDSALDLQNYDVSALVGDQTDYCAMLENEDSWFYFAGGRGAQLDIDALRQAYDAEETYVGGLEAYLAEALLQLTLDSDEPVTGGSAEENLLVWDDAGLLSEAEAVELSIKLLGISEQYQAEIRVVTLPSVDGGDVDEFLHFLYDESNFGYGENRDGVLLLVCMDPREYRILSNGFAGDAITSSGIEMIGDEIQPDLSAGDYVSAFDAFADQCEYYLDGYINGFPFNVTTSLLIAVVVGLVAAVIVTTVLKGQLKSVRKQRAANVYVKPGTLQISQSGDYFMYSNVTKTEKEKKGSSSGGGSSRSTGGGSF